MKRYYCNKYEVYKQFDGEYVRYKDVVNLINDCLVLHPYHPNNIHTKGWQDAFNKLKEKMEKK